MNYNTNIEKTLLSSIIYDPKLLDEVKLLIDKSDFSAPYRDIYVAILHLDDAQKPIDEHFIAKELERQRKFNPDLLTDVMIANPLSSSTLQYYAKGLKVESLKAKITKATHKLMEGDLGVVDEIRLYKEKIDEIEGIKVLKNDAWSDFARWDLDVEELESLKFEYLLDHFIVKNEITMISARPGTGKSLLAVSLSNMLLMRGSTQRVIYLDGDNSLSTVSSRGIGDLKRKHQDRFMYFCGRSKREFEHIISKLRQMDLSECLVVFDSIKNFIQGDRDKNKDVSEAMEIIKSLRNNGATVLLLHHQNKKQKDHNSNYAGSSAFEEDVSNAFVMERNDDKDSLILKPFKARSGELFEQAYRYNKDNTLTKLDLEYAKQNREDEEMIEETLEFLRSFRGTPMWSDLWKNLTEQGYDKEKASNVIKAGVGKLWNFYKGERNNQKLYYLLESTNSSSVQNSTRTPRTPNIGLYGGVEVVEYDPRSPRTHSDGGLSSVNEQESSFDSSEKSQNRHDDLPRERDIEAVYI